MFEFIETIESLLVCLEHILVCKVVGLDIEFNSDHVYNGIICLVQFSTAEFDYVIDAIVLRDHLELLRGVLESTKIIKVVHDAALEKRAFRDQLRIELKGIFDTSIASQHIFHARYSLKYLAEHHFGVVLTKSHQRRDWTRRPLSAQEIEYAMNDSRYARMLYFAMAAGLDKTAIDAISEESNRRLQTRFVDPFKRVASKARFALTALHQQQLREACAWRQRTAQEADIGVYVVVSDKDLLCIIREQPKTLARLQMCIQDRALEGKLHELFAIIHASKPLTSASIS